MSVCGDAVHIHYKRIREMKPEELVNECLNWLEETFNTREKLFVREQMIDALQSRVKFLEARLEEMENGN